MQTSVYQPALGADLRGFPYLTRVISPQPVADPLLDRFDLGYLWRKFRIALLVVPLLGALLGLGVALLRQPLYESSALLLVDPGYDRMVHSEEPGNSNRSEMEALKSLEIAIVADTVLLRAVERLGLRGEAGFLPSDLASPGTPDMKVLKFLREQRVGTSLVPETRIIRIRVLDPEPERAKRLADALSEEYETYLGEQRRKAIAKIRVSLEAQAERARLGALESDKRLDEFRSRHPRFPVEQDHGHFASRLSEFSAQLNAVTGRRLELESQVRALDSLDPGIEAIEMIRVAGYTDMPHVSAMLDTLSNARAEMSVARENFTDSHPAYRNLRAKVAGHETEVAELARSVKTALTASYLAEKSREESLAAELENAKAEFAEMKSLSSEFRALRQQTEREWSVHEAIQSRLSESAVAMETGGEMATLVSEPMVPYKKAKPSLLLHLVCGGASGTALIGGALVFAILSGLPVSSGPQLEARLGLPVIADWSDSKKPLVPRNSPALMQYLGGYRHQATLISAPGLNGAVGPVARQVALAAAENGRRTLLISIRRGTVKGQIQPGGHGNLFLLDLDPRFVSDRERFVAGLAELKESFDNIFIEAGGSEEPEIVQHLCSLTDQGVVVVGKGRTRKQDIEERVARLSRPGAAPLALILVGAD